MTNDNGKVMSQSEILKEALNCLSDACCFLFELQSYESQCLAFMVDSALKLGQVIYRNDNPLVAACNYEEYEIKRANNLEVIK